MPIFHDVYPRSTPGEDGDGDDAGTRHERGGDAHEERPASRGSGWDGAMLESPDARPMSRGELIERIKRGESPTWTLQHHFRQQSPRPSTPPVAIPSPTTSPTPPALLPAAEIEHQPRPVSQESDAYQAGSEIERPRSALHSGDFRDAKTTATEGAHGDLASGLSTSPPAPWSNAFHAAYKATKQQGLERYFGLPLPERAPSRSRAISQASLPSSFVLLPPTSPLVNSSLNPDLDFSQEPLPRSAAQSPTRDSRRHTFSPQSFQNFRHYNADRFSTPPRGPPSFRREATHPYQAHQPRRSISSLSQNAHSSTAPQTPHVGPRRPSISSDTSPLHHAPMVGSYEESILRGRMSTTPSRPLNFVAQIGVLGRGSCKPSLRCPPHVTVPFPAVFYSYGTGSGRITDNQPSPYVGLIDLEHNLVASENADAESRPRSWRRKTFSPDRGLSDPHFSDGERDPSPCDILSPMRQRKLEHQKRRSGSPRQLRSPPGGSYRIPSVGQLQIVIKNPHKTAVKLFLVPYDLSDMEPGTKTFIRQRSYSAGPVIDMPLSSRSNLGTDRPEASLSTSDDPRDRPVLRYLVHLNVCCLGKRGSERYYLYKGVRVVFANRVPDGKEKLRNEVQLPEPRYSVYKPVRDSVPSAETGRNSLARDLASRRRSAGFFPSDRTDMDSMDGIVSTSLQSDLLQRADNHLGFKHYAPASSNVHNGHASSFIDTCSDARRPTPPFPLGYRRCGGPGSRPASRDTMCMDHSDSQSRTTEECINRSPSPESPSVGRVERRQSEAFVRNSNGNLELNECVLGSGLEFGRVESPPPRAWQREPAQEGLLSRNLKRMA